MNSSLLRTNLGGRELGAELLHNLRMRPAGRAVIAVVLLDENGEGVRRAGSLLLGGKETKGNVSRPSLLHQSVPELDYLIFLAHLIEPPAGRGRGGRRLEVNEQLESAATFAAHFPLNVEGLGVAAILVPALDAPVASRQVA